MEEKRIIKGPIITSEEADRITKEVNEELEKIIINNSRKHISAVLKQIIDMMKQYAGCVNCKHYDHLKCRACTWEEAIDIVESALIAYDEDYWRETYG